MGPLPAGHDVLDEAELLAWLGGPYHKMSPAVVPTRIKMFKGLYYLSTLSSFSLRQKQVDSIECLLF